ncbi:MAG: glycoside hydrolase family 97 protein [Cytophagaceae bacterium]|nr:glycoside hydrolase family 97 protein [Cytophagaceae bacterium]MDW8455686.1 glycoside hydrolase family 97 protein [Cytophagaceae bacterium]
MKSLIGLNLFFIFFFSIHATKTYGLYKAKHVDSISSPDSKIILEIVSSEKGELKYLVRKKNTVMIIDTSSLGIKSKEFVFVDYLSVVKVEKRNGIEKLTMPYGPAKNSYEPFNELNVFLENPHKERIHVIFRIFNDGVAFRYLIPSQGKTEFISITEEKTEFNFEKEYTCWGMRGYTRDFEGFQSVFTTNTLGIDTLTSMPVTILLNNEVCISLLEADLHDYAGMNLKNNTLKKNSIVGVLTPRKNDPEVAVFSTLPLKSPWRVIQIAESSVKLIESTIVLRLNPPPDSTADFSWVKPGKCCWTWYAGGPTLKIKEEGFNGLNNKSVKKYIDFTHQMKFQYFIIDAGWSKGHEHDSMARKRVELTNVINTLSIPKLADYCAKKNIGLGLWCNYASVKDNPDKVFKLFRDWGVKVVKVDFFSADDQQTVNDVVKIVKAAADNQLLVDLHSVYKPTGLSRTYPNLLTIEGVMGMEYNKWIKVTPEHNVILPFTRMLVGPMDYTPGSFNNVPDSVFIPKEIGTMTACTRAHQLAMYVVYESYLQMLSDPPSRVLNKPGAEFLKNLPTDWDETLGLMGKPGEYIVLARRKDEHWYVGIMNNSSHRKISLNLSDYFVGKYDITIYKDDVVSKNFNSIITESFPSESRKNVEIELLGSGGSVLVLKKKGQN